MDPIHRMKLVNNNKPKGQRPRAVKSRANKSNSKNNSAKPLLRNRPIQPRDALNLGSQIGTVVRTKMTRLGVSDIRRLRIAWVLGYTYVGNGTSGTALGVYLQTASGTWLVKGFAAGSSGQAPILNADLDLGQTYVKDIIKHFARLVVKRMWVHVDSLQPSTSNNMMAMIGISRGPGGAPASIPITVATASVTFNSVGNVASMRSAFPVDSFESKTLEITEFIAGGSGPKQNEFEIQDAIANASFYTTTATATVIDPDGLVPSCIAVAGNCTTAGLEGTNVHQISIEQEIDLLDYLGGMSLADAE